MPFWQGSKQKARLLHSPFPCWNNEGQWGAKVKTMLSSSKLQKHFGKHISFDHPEQCQRHNPRDNHQVPPFPTITTTQVPMIDTGCLQQAVCHHHHYQNALPQHFHSTPLVLSRNCVL